MSVRLAPRSFAAMRIDGAPHVGLLLDNVPDFTMWTGAAAVSGATMVGLNPTRRGAELARDITHTECQLVVTDAANRLLLDDLDLGAANDRVLVIDTPDYEALVASHRRRAVAGHRGRRDDPAVAPVHVGNERRTQGRDLQPRPPRPRVARSHRTEPTCRPTTCPT